MSASWRISFSSRFKSRRRARLQSLVVRHDQHVVEKSVDCRAKPGGLPERLPEPVATIDQRFDFRFPFLQIREQLALGRLPEGEVRSSTFCRSWPPKSRAFPIFLTRLNALRQREKFLGGRELGEHAQLAQFIGRPDPSSPALIRDGANVANIKPTLLEEIRQTLQEEVSEPNELLSLASGTHRWPGSTSPAGSDEPSSR